MIVTHLPQTYPSVLSSMMSSRDRRDVLAKLAEFTLGDWTRVSDAAIEQYGDVVVGVYRGRVVSAFDVTGFTRSDEGLVIFAGVPSQKWAWLIGSEVPGGPWKRGEARPVRYFESSAVFDQHEGLEKHVVGVQDPEDRMFEVAEAHAHKELQAQRVAHEPAATLLERVEVALNPRGGINVTVPAGTRVTVIPRQD